MVTNKKELKINYQLNFLRKKQILFSSVINLDIKISRLFICGKVGSGKSSFLKIIAGIIKPNFCELTFDKKTFTNTKKKIFTPLYQRKVVYLWQESILFSHLTVLENLLFSKEAKNFVNKNYWIEALDLKNLLFKIPEELSGGEKQKISLLQAIFSKPNLLLLDESFSFMDEETKQNCLQILLEFQKKHLTTIIYVSHFTTDEKGFAKEKILLEKGKVKNILI